MTATLASLLHALDRQREQLPSAASVGSELHARHAWAILVRAACRALTALPVTATPQERGALTVLLPLAAEVRPGAVLGLYAPIADIATTLGGIADLLHIPVVASPVVVAAAQRNLVGHALAALRDSAVWTGRTLPITPNRSLLGRQLPRLASLDVSHHRGIDEVNLYPWRSVRAHDAGIDGAVASWSSVALATLGSPHNLTQLALQLAAADIALICAAAAASGRAGIRTQTLHQEYSATVNALAQASESWRRTAGWPSHVRLGGRSRDVRDASRQLREQITTQLRDGQHWTADRRLGAPGMIATLLWATQTAHHVGVAHEHALHELTCGTPPVWVARDKLTTDFRPIADQLATAHYAWIPDLPDQHPARPLAEASSKGLTAIRTALLNARPAVSAAADNNVWETLAPPTAAMSPRNRAGEGMPLLTPRSVTQSSWY